MNVTKGSWVEIENVVLQPHERAAHLPEDTQKCPMIMWTRGFLLAEAGAVGDTVEIRTLAERTAQGKLVDIRPRHQYDYGDTVVELLEVGEELKQELSKLMEAEA